jgi:hypothetical protein
MSDTMSDTSIGPLLEGIGALLVPFARIYLGPSAAIIEKNERDVSAGQRRLLLFAMHKLVVEAGTLPAPGAAYAPHDGAFVVDAEGRAPALDLRYVLAALRAFSAWADTGPTDPAATKIDTANTSSTATAAAPISSRTLRMSARTTAASPSMRGPARTVVPTRTGGCGCRGGASSYASPYGSSFTTAATPATTRARRTRVRDASCVDPKPQCDCGGTCGGRGCGCAGQTSCTDCLPRGASAGDLCGCTCGTCTPPPPEECTPWTPSCATRNRLRACLKDILCELLACVENFLCPGGVFGNPSQQAYADFVKCLTDLLCKLLRCIREAICPPPKPPQISCPPPIDCLPCSYAVEDPR